MRRLFRSCGLLLLGAGLLATQAPQGQAQEAKAPARVSLAFVLPSGSETDRAVRTAVAAVPGVRDVSVARGVVSFAVADERSVRLSDVSRAVSTSAGDEATVNRETLALRGDVELTPGSLSNEQMPALRQAIASVGGRVVAEKCGGATCFITCTFPRSALLADIEKAVTKAVAAKEGWQVKEIVWTGPKKAAPTPPPVSSPPPAKPGGC